MKLVIFGHTVSSSWGNGHAALWRGLTRALGAQGHKVVFFEQDVPYYAEHRDLDELDGGRLVLYDSWEEIEATAEHELDDADFGLVTSQCPDAKAASELLRASRSARIFYDMDTALTLERVDAGKPLDYLPEGGLADFDLVLSVTGGAALGALRTRLGARRVAPLYGCVDPLQHKPCAPRRGWSADLSYLGSWAGDRQDRLESLFMAPARRLPLRNFLLGGTLYPAHVEWPENVQYVPHVPPPDHGAFYASASMTLNVTRDAMARLGFCPSSRLFEAAACGVPVLSDWWPGIDEFFEPGSEILIADDTDQAMAALALPPAALRRMGVRAHKRVLAEHSASRRARQLLALLGERERHWGQALEVAG